MDLFSGIGGFALAAQNVWQDDHKPELFCDFDTHCQAVLAKHWPRVPIYGDILDLSAEKHWRRFPPDAHDGEWHCRRNRPTHQTAEHVEPRIDLVTGGFPCQPFSTAGQRRGTNDDRFLWPQMHRVIREFHPRWIIAENVRGLLSQERGLVFEQVCADLERLAYDVQAFVIPAAGVGAPHRRDRVWIVANARGSQSQRLSNERRRNPTQAEYADRDVANAASPRLERAGEPETSRFWSIDCAAHRIWRESWPEVAARLCRMDHGLPRRMDRAARLKALGNAIVPQVAEQIMHAIKHADDVMAHG